MADEGTIALNITLLFCEVEASDCPISFEVYNNKTIYNLIHPSGYTVPATMQSFGQNNNSHYIIYTPFPGIQFMTLLLCIAGGTKLL